MPEPFNTEDQSTTEERVLLSGDEGAPLSLWLMKEGGAAGWTRLLAAPARACESPGCAPSLSSAHTLVPSP